jgi:hypothetical protein
LPSIPSCMGGLPSLEIGHCCQLGTGIDCSVPKTPGKALRGIVFGFGYGSPFSQAVVTHYGLLGRAFCAVSILKLMRNVWVPGSTTACSPYGTDQCLV